MMTQVLAMQRQKRFVIQAIAFFIVFLGLYTLLDFLNSPYAEMKATYGLVLVIGNVLLNIVMASISMVLLNLSSALVKLTGKEGKGTFMSAISVFFGMLTYGCTPCVITFFAMIGISFSVVALPLAGLPYKFISLGLLLLGALWLIYEINHVKCKIKPQRKQNTDDQV